MEYDLMKTHVLIQLRLVLVLLVLCCGLYPAVVRTVGRIVFPRQAEGSLLRRDDGTVLGAELLGQRFASPAYFHGRPSAVAWNASGSGGSNLAPTNPALVSRVVDSVIAAGQLDRLTTATVAADRIYASGSGLDPDITPENARQQVERVAKARGLADAYLSAIVARNVTPPLLGFLGPPHVNVLRLNLALDTEAPILGQPAERGSPQQ
jgi:potassium-transporting ATPase KdpC subunit